MLTGQPGLRIAAGRQVFLLADGRAAVLDGCAREGRILAASGLAEVLDHAAVGLDQSSLVRLALRGHTGLLRRLRAAGLLVPPKAPDVAPHDIAAEGHFVAVLDLRQAPRVDLPPADGRPLLLLVADHLDPELEPALQRVWSRGITAITVACRPGRLLAGPIAPPNHPCIGCLRRRQAGLRPLAAALWAGLGGARALPQAEAELAETRRAAARLALDLLDRRGHGLLSAAPGEMTVAHPLHAGPGCGACPDPGPASGPASNPVGLLAAIAPWIDAESGLASPAEAATPPTAAVAIRLSRPALVQTTTEFDVALAHGLSHCVGKGTANAAAELAAVAEAIERGALLHGPDPCVAQSLCGPGTLVVPRARAVLAPAAGGPSDLDFEPSGTAFGRDVPDATLRALLECIERDAALIWWRRQARLPPLALPENIAALRDMVACQLGAESAAPWVLDATTELGARVAVAVSVRQDGTWPLVGFGAGLDAGVEAAGALRELVAQGERLAGALRQPAAAGAAAPLLDWSGADPAAHRFLRPDGAPRLPRRPSASSLAELAKGLLDAGFEPFALRHAELWPGGPCVMRVLVPGLQGTALSAGNTSRLRLLPERLGWACSPYREDGLNPWGFPG